MGNDKLEQNIREYALYVIQGEVLQVGNISLWNTGEALPLCKGGNI